MDPVELKSDPAPASDRRPESRQTRTESLERGGEKKRSISKIPKAREIVF